MNSNSFPVLCIAVTVCYMVTITFFKTSPFVFLRIKSESVIHLWKDIFHCIQDSPQECLRSCSSAQNIFHHLEAEINTSQTHTHNSSPLICDEAFNTTANVGNNLTVTLSKTRNILRALRKSAYYYRDITTAIAA